MRYIGMCFLFLAAGLVSYVYEGRLRLRERQGEAFLSFMTALRREVACYAKPPGAFAAAYRHETLEQMGFLPALRESGSLSCALAACDRHSLSAAMWEVLCSIADSFGRGYREDELRTLDARLSELQTIVHAENEAHPKNGRLCRTLCVSLSLLCVLLFL